MFTTTMTKKQPFKLLAISSIFFSAISGMIFSFFLINNNRYQVKVIDHGCNAQYTAPTAQMKITRFGSIVGKFIDYENMTSPGIKYGESKICIASMFINYPINITNRILNHQQYAKLWGYSYFYIDNKSYLSEIGNLYKLTWFKPWIIKELLHSNKFDYVLWIDSDAVFMNCHIPLTFVIKHVINLLHEQRYNEYIVYSMLISPDINNMNAGVLVFKNNEWAKNLLSAWIKMYYKLEAVSFPDYYQYSPGRSWGGDNAPLVMLLNGYNPYTTDNITEKDFQQYLHHIGAQYINDVKELQYNEFLLHKSLQNDVGLIPQSFFNSFERESNTHLILHCAGSDKCKNLLPQILPTSSCSKSEILLKNNNNKQIMHFDDEFIKAFCVFQAYEMKKCIDNILSIFSNMNNAVDVVSQEAVNYHSYYMNNYIGDDLILFILSFFATQRSPNSKLILWKTFANNIITVENIKIRFVNHFEIDACLFDGSRIEVNVFDINLWHVIASTYNINNYNYNNINRNNINSDLIRFVVLYHYGGIWFEIDTILLKDFSILYDVEYVYPYSYELEVNTAVLSLKKYRQNGTIDLLFKRILTNIMSEEQNLTCNAFSALNLMDNINPNHQPQLKILPIYLFDATWYASERARGSNSYIIEQNDLEYPYWLPQQKSKHDSYFMYINEKIDDYSWNKINNDISNFLPYSMSNHYHDVLRQNNITKGSWLDFYRKEYISRIRHKLIC